MPRIPSGFIKRSASSDLSPPTRPRESSDAIASTKAKPASGKAAQSSDSTNDDADTKVATYWCQAPGQGLLVEFRDSWILELVSGGLATDTASDRAMSWKVVVPGICPFHVVAKQFKGDRTWCGGMFTHAHESQEAGPNFVNDVTDKSLVLKRPLITAPMPMHALIMSPELRAASLYFYFDLKFRASYPEEYANLRAVPPAILELDACERRWKLNEEYQYSVESWASRIGKNNMLINLRGNRVPYPQNHRFRSSGSRLAFGFWSSFQQAMWNIFLTKDVGPCYLDAVFDLNQNGFQLWTLLFEYGGLTVPISFLITTSVTTTLLSDWLTEIAGADSDLPKKTIYVNTMQAYDFVGSVLPEWDIRYSKYYIVQELRELVLRGDHDAYNEDIVREVQRINADFLPAFMALRRVKDIPVKMNYVFSKTDEWLPKSKPELALFNHSSDALSRWRYLLWMTMLGRPSTTRIDLVLYYLHAVLMPGIESAYCKNQDHSLALVPFNMDAMEYGGSPLHESVRELRKRSLDGSLVCLSEDRELGQKAIVDTDLQVCYCEKFLQNKMCPHLVFCMPSAIHHPALPRLLQEIPRA
ncbi:hypothetical protein GGI19_002812 [Coemansia pectinata]|uniref:SWIM-type domain-containing protein n=1 Tax=Coemansia pectinata TaxID=1052879 RepID=A0A9W8GV12_9FUNG|nr:hypothetical protein GGI19_002812 [Coemansia pectinata]